MTEYFRDVADPRRLLAKERDPVTGRRVPGHDSKRDDSPSRDRRPRRQLRPRRYMVVGGGAIGALVVAGAVTAAVVAGGGGDDSADAPSPASVATESDETLESLAPAGSEAAVTPIATTDPAATDAATTSPASSSSVPTSPAIPSVVAMLASATATSAEVIPNDPGATASYEGPLPTFQLPISCGASGCSLSLRDVSPGAITTDGLTTVESVGGRFDVVATRIATCTGSDGASYSRQVTQMISLALSGAQEIDGVVVPDHVAGTLTTSTPDAGYVPRVGEVVEEGTPTGCPGNTTTFVVDGPVNPA